MGNVVYLRPEYEAQRAKVEIDRVRVEVGHAFYVFAPEEQFSFPPRDTLTCAELGYEPEYLNQSV